MQEVLWQTHVLQRLPGGGRPPVFAEVTHFPSGPQIRKVAPKWPLWCTALEQSNDYNAQIRVISPVLSRSLSSPENRKEAAAPPEAHYLAVGAPSNKTSNLLCGYVAENYTFHCSQ